MPPLYHQGCPDLRVLHLVLHQPLTLHYIVRRASNGPNEAPHNSEILFILREADHKLLRKSNESLLGTTGCTEQHIRDALGLFAQGQHIWATPYELKILKYADLLTKRAPRALLITATHLIFLLRYFGCLLLALVLECVIMCIESERRLLRDTLRCLDWAIEGANEHFKVPPGSRVTYELLYESARKHGQAYPPPWAAAFSETQSPCLSLFHAMKLSRILARPNASSIPWCSLLNKQQYHTVLSLCNVPPHDRGTIPDFPLFMMPKRSEFHPYVHKRVILPNRIRDTRLDPGYTTINYREEDDHHHHHHYNNFYTYNINNNMNTSSQNIAYNKYSDKHLNKIEQSKGTGRDPLGHILYHVTPLPHTSNDDDSSNHNDNTVISNDTTTTTATPISDSNDSTIVSTTSGNPLSDVAPSQPPPPPSSSDDNNNNDTTQNDESSPPPFELLLSPEHSIALDIFVIRMPQSILISTFYTPYDPTCDIMGPLSTTRSSDDDAIPQQSSSSSPSIWISPKRTPFHQLHFEYYMSPLNPLPGVASGLLAAPLDIYAHHGFESSCIDYSQLRILNMSAFGSVRPGEVPGEPLASTTLPTVVDLYPAPMKPSPPGSYLASVPFLDSPSTDDDAQMMTAVAPAPPPQSTAPVTTTNKRSTRSSDPTTTSTPPRSLIQEAIPGGMTPLTNDHGLPPPHQLKDLSINPVGLSFLPYLFVPAVQRAIVADQIYPSWPSFTYLNDPMTPPPLPEASSGLIEQQPVTITRRSGPLSVEKLKDEVLLPPPPPQHTRVVTRTQYNTGLSQYGVAAQTMSRHPHHNNNILPDPFMQPVVPKTATQPRCDACYCTMKRDKVRPILLDVAPDTDTSSQFSIENTNKQLAAVQLHNKDKDKDTYNNSPLSLLYSANIRNPRPKINGVSLNHITNKRDKLFKDKDKDNDIYFDTFVHDYNISSSYYKHKNNPNYTGYDLLDGPRPLPPSMKLPPKYDSSYDHNANVISTMCDDNDKTSTTSIPSSSSRSRPYVRSTLKTRSKIAAEMAAAASSPSGIPSLSTAFIPPPPSLPPTQPSSGPLPLSVVFTPSSAFHLTSSFSSSGHLIDTFSRPEGQDVQPCPCHCHIRTDPTNAVPLFIADNVAQPTCSVVPFHVLMSMAFLYFNTTQHDRFAGDVWHQHDTPRFDPTGCPYHYNHSRRDTLSSSPSHNTTDNDNNTIDYDDDNIYIVDPYKDHTTFETPETLLPLAMRNTTRCINKQSCRLGSSTSSTSSSAPSTRPPSPLPDVPQNKSLERITESVLDLLSKITAPVTYATTIFPYSDEVLNDIYENGRPPMMQDNPVTPDELARSALDFQWYLSAMQGTPSVDEENYWKTRHNSKKINKKSMFSSISSPIGGDVVSPEELSSLSDQQQQHSASSGSGNGGSNIPSSSDASNERLDPAPYDDDNDDSMNNLQLDNPTTTTMTTIPPIITHNNNNNNEEPRELDYELEYESYMMKIDPLFHINHGFNSVLMPEIPPPPSGPARFTFAVVHPPLLKTIQSDDIFDSRLASNALALEFARKQKYDEKVAAEAEAKRQQELSLLHASSTNNNTVTSTTATSTSGGPASAPAPPPELHTVPLPPLSSRHEFARASQVVLTPWCQTYPMKPYDNRYNSCFPYLITRETLPLWRAFQYHLSVLSESQLMLLYRHAGMMFTYDESLEEQDIREAIPVAKDLVLRQNYRLQLDMLSPESRVFSMPPPRAPPPSKGKRNKTPATKKIAAAAAKGQREEHQREQRIIREGKAREQRLIREEKAREQRGIREEKARERAEKLQMEQEARDAAAAAVAEAEAAERVEQQKQYEFQQQQQQQQQIELQQHYQNEPQVYEQQQYQQYQLMSQQPYQQSQQQYPMNMYTVQQQPQQIVSPTHAMYQLQMQQQGYWQSPPQQSYISPDQQSVPYTTTSVMPQQYQAQYIPAQQPYSASGQGVVAIPVSYSQQQQQPILYTQPQPTHTYLPTTGYISQPQQPYYQSPPQPHQPQQYAPIQLTHLTTAPLPHQQQQLLNVPGKRLLPSTDRDGNPIPQHLYDGRLHTTYDTSSPNQSTNMMLPPHSSNQNSYVPPQTTVAPSSSLLNQFKPQQQQQQPVQLPYLSTNMVRVPSSSQPSTNALSSLLGGLSSAPKPPPLASLLNQASTTSNPPFMPNGPTLSGLPQPQQQHIPGLQPPRPPGSLPLQLPPFPHLPPPPPR